jgi:hypothetical protein
MINLETIEIKLSYSSLQALIIERHSNPDYAWVEYGDFKMLMHLESEKFNVTKIVKEDGKEIKHWLENQSSIEIINASFAELNFIDGVWNGNTFDYEAEFKSDIKFPIMKLSNVANDLRGTYVDRLLLPHILCWCSPKFAIRISKIVNQYFIDKANKTIFNLETMVKENRENHELAMKKADQQMEQQKIHYESTISEIRSQAEKEHL